LASQDAAKAYRAIGALGVAPEKAIRFLAKRMRPITRPDDKQLAGWIAELDSLVFADREKATHELERLGEVAEPWLRKALASEPSPEVRRRVEALLNKLQGAITSPETLRSVRAIEALEHIANPEARKVLQSLTSGAPEARLTHEAKAAVQRLERR
jgi:hypothetical protein